MLGFSRVSLSKTENVFWIPYTSMQDTNILIASAQVLKRPDLLFRMVCIWVCVRVSDREIAID